MDTSQLDSDCTELIGSDVALTGREFVSRYPHGFVGSLDSVETLLLIERLYDLGATELHVCDIVPIEFEFGGSDADAESAVIVVDLPEGGLKRADIYSACAAVPCSTEVSLYPSDDQGQRYLQAWFD